MARSDIRLVLPDGNGRWRSFCRPRQILTAAKIGDVALLLSEVDHALARGKYAAGWVAFEAAAAFDPAHQTHPPAAGMPLAWFAIFDRPPRPFSPPSESEYAFGALQNAVGRDEYLAAVDNIRRQIRAGEVYQVNLTHQRRAVFLGSPLACFLSLAKRQPSPWNFFAETEHWAVCSWSPECFFSQDGEHITVKPMKGTRPNRPGMAAALFSSLKERAENLMIVDMLRNDLSRLPNARSVRGGPLLEVEEYPTVLQMTSTVQCTARAQLSDIFRALFPCASVTGAPKIAALRQIHGLENAPRGVYCGSAGWAGGGQARFNVAIRTALIDKRAGTMRYGVGGGVVMDSIGGEEWEETMDKAALLHGQPPLELIETMRVEDGTVRLLARHLARLFASARYLGFSFAADKIRRAIEQRARGQTMCLRLTMNIEGETQLESSPLPPPTTRLRAIAASAPVCAQNLLLRHKTNRRAVYDAAHREAIQAGANDALLVNEAGEVTETCIANVIVNIRGRWLTPPLTCGLLPGVMRAELLAQGAIGEQKIPLSALRQAEKICRINALRGREEMTLIR